MFQFHANSMKWCPILLVCILVGCNDASNEKQNTITTKEMASDEGNTLEKSIQKMEGVEDAKIMQSNDQLLVAIKITRQDRFQIEEITKKVNKKLEAKYPTMDVTVSPDKKIFLEMNQFENKHTNKQFDENTIHKKVKSLIKLSKDEG